MRGLVDETKELALKTIINIDDQGGERSYDASRG